MIADSGENYVRLPSQTAVANREDYEEITSELTKMAETLYQYVNELASEDSSGSVEHILR